MSLHSRAKRRIDALIDPIKEAILGGSPQNLHEYHRLVGKYEGIINAFREIEDLLKEDDSDLDDTGR